MPHHTTISTRHSPDALVRYLDVTWRDSSGTTRTVSVIVQDSVPQIVDALRRLADFLEHDTRLESPRPYTEP